VPARPRCLTGGSRLSPPARALPLSLLLPRGPVLSAPFLAPACPLSLFRGAHLSARPQPPTHVPRHGRAHDRAFSGHLCTSSPLLSPGLRSPTFPRSLAPSAKPSRPLSRSAHATRKLCRRSPKTVVRSATAVDPVPRFLPR
jgi:hypothetical protein